MITKSTVLVLGAGASIPYGFPSGQGLVDLICDGSNDFKRVIANIALASIHDVTKFVDALEEADIESIDVFLGNNPEFEKVGKAAIAVILLPREGKTELRSKWRSLRLKGEKSKWGGHWYKYLSNLLLSNTFFEEFDQNKLSIVTFNYDRSLEYYLFSMLRANFHGKHQEECAAKMKAIKIIHVYGQLGYLPWQNLSGQSIPFGLQLRWDDAEAIQTFRHATQGIKTMSEDFDENDSDIKLARQLLTQATRIYFLGFGYHPINLKILGIESLGDKNIRGTSLGLSFQRKVDLGKLSVSTLKWSKKRMNPTYLYDEDVYEFLHKHAILD